MVHDWGSSISQSGPEREERVEGAASVPKDFSLRGSDRITESNLL
jgi:hypothetical protein